MILSDFNISGALTYVASWCGTNTLMTGDFNGDGRTDQYCWGPSPTIRVRLATASGFAPPTVWYNNMYGSQFLGDFNGDGKTDIAYYGGAHDGYFYVGLSTGSSFNAPVSWGRSGIIYDSGDPPRGHMCNGTASITVGDFNGDGNSDVFCRKYGDEAYTVGISNGTSSFSFSVWTTSVCEMAFGTGDFNGDGKTDLYCFHAQNGYLYTFLSNGGAFPYGNGTYMPATFCATTQYVFGDFNGDGKTDVACTGNGNVALSNGATFVEQGAFGAWCSSGAVTTGDFDGDGTTEIACNGGGTTSA